MRSTAIPNTKVLQGLLWNLRGNPGGCDGAGWVPLQMALTETEEPDASAYLLARVRQELLQNCESRSDLERLTAVGPNVQALMRILKLTAAPTRGHRAERLPRRDRRTRQQGQDSKTCRCEDCGCTFEQNVRGRPRKRCKRCSPPS